MLRIHAPLFMIVYRDVGGVTGALAYHIASARGENELLSDYMRGEVHRVVEQMVNNIAQVPISHLLRQRIRRLWDHIEQEDGLKTYTYMSAMNTLKELSNDVLMEFQRPVFLMIPDDRAAFYKNRLPFGEEVKNAFPEASYDIEHAAQLMALDEWTGAVFHLMRASELALHRLCRMLRIGNVKTREWTQLIQDIDKAIDGLRKKPRTLRRDRRVQYLGDARASLSGFRDAFRNHVMHARARYDELAAHKIYTHVEAFMITLASSPSEMSFPRHHHLWVA